MTKALQHFYLGICLPYLITKGCQVIVFYLLCPVSWLSLLSRILLCTWFIIYFIYRFVFCFRRNFYTSLVVLKLLSSCSIYLQNDHQFQLREFHIFTYLYFPSDCLPHLTVGKSFKFPILSVVCLPTSTINFKHLLLYHWATFN